MKEKIEYKVTPPEGELNMYYGLIGNGKSYLATRDAIRDLNHGYNVKTNFPIAWNGYDQRKVWYWGILGLLWLKREFLVFPKDNYTFFDVSPGWAIEKGFVDWYDWFAQQTSCKIYLDEGHLAYDSYKMTRMGLDQRIAILDTRHFDRSVSVISQRSTAIHVSLRGNVNRFFKCEKILEFHIPFTKFKITRFKKTEFQEMDASERPDETQDEEGNYLKEVNHWYYWGRPKYFRMYDTKWRRGNLGDSQPDYTQVIHTNPWTLLKFWFKK